MRVPGGSDDQHLPYGFARELDERTLVLRLRDGDAAMLEQLMHAYFDRLVRFVLRMVGSRDAAEDVVQNVFVRVWAQRSGLDPDRPVRAFLFRAVRNQALNDLKYRHVRDRFLNTALDDAQYDDDAGSVASTEDEILSHMDIEAGLSRLSPRHQFALRLRLEEQLTHTEIAEVLSISPKAAEQLVLRAVDHLRRRLRPKNRP